MTRRILAVPVLAIGCCLLTTPLHNLQAQNAQPVKKFEKISKELNLTPQQKMQFIPILEQEGPKVEAIKNDTSLTRMQKIEQLRAVHAQTDPQVRSILTPDQYAKLQDIRQKEIETAVKKRMNQ
jgi:protein CpxP